MKYLVQYSGGKDSLATLLYVMEHYNNDKIEVVFCDTGWEHNITYKHIKYIKEKTGLKFITLKSEKFKDFETLSLIKKRVASTRARFCTIELKVVPFIDYVLSLKENVIVFQGIRKNESKSRSLMSKQCTYFKYYFESRGLDKKGKPKFDTYRRKEVKEWCKNFNADIERPIFDWTANEVFDFIKSKDYKFNELYKKGFLRVGCFPCIMCVKSEIKLIADEFPETIEKIVQLEAKVQRTFFPPKYIPPWACKNGEYPTIQDVVKYVQDNPDQISLIEKEVQSCKSIYNICE